MSRVQWEDFSKDGVLLLTSFREGLPSVVLEALSHGLLCVAYDVGALNRLRVDTLELISRTEYPEIVPETFERLAARIRRHLASESVHLGKVSYRDQLLECLRHSGVIR